MTTIVTRASKGSALTHAEMDANFINLNTELAVHIDDAIDAHVSSAIGYLPAGTGAVATDVQTKLREFVSDVDYNADNTGATDTTSKLNLLISENDVCEIGAGTYLVTSLTIPSNKKIKTAGAKTVFQQKAGVTAGTCTIVIDGSNIEIGDFTVKGQIATATGEQDHGVFIRGSSAALSNIKLGCIYGENIRGDVVYMGGTASAGGVSEVTIDGVSGNNIYRNVVTVSGAENVNIGYIKGSAVGLDIFDIEPNANSTPCANIHVSHIKGGFVGVLGYQSTVVVRGVIIDFLDLDPAYQINCTPAYSSYQNAIGLQTRSARGVKINYFKANGFTSHAYKNIYAAGDVNTQNVIFDYVDFTNCSTTDTTYHAACLIPFVDNFIINSGTVAPYDLNKVVVFGDSGTPANARVSISNLQTTAKVARYCAFSEFENINVNTSDDKYIFQGCQNSTVRNSQITAGRLAGLCSKMNFVNVTGTFATLIFDGSNTDHFLENCTLNSVYYKFGPYLLNKASSLYFGGYYLWVDATGKLRINNGVPATDTSGTVVGTQV